MGRKIELLILIGINSLLGLFAAFRDIKNGNLNATFVISLFLSMFAYLWVPMRDVQYIYLRYHDYKLSSFSDIFVYWRNDYFLDIILWFFAQYNIPYALVIYLFVFIMVEIFFYIYKDLYRRFELKGVFRNYLFTCLFFLVSIPYWFVITGLRNGLSISFLILGSYYLLVTNNYRGLIALIIAPLIHFSTIIFSIIVLFVFICGKIGTIIISRNIFIFSVILSFLLSNLFFKYINTGFFDNIIYSSSIEVYGSKSSYLDDMSLTWRFFNSLSSMRIIPLSIIYFRLYNRKDSQNLYLYILFIFIAALSGLPIIFGRFLNILYLYLFVYIIVRYKPNTINNMLCRIYVVFGAGIFFINYLLYYTVVKESLQYLLIILPYPALYFMGYDNLWFENNMLKILNE